MKEKDAKIKEAQGRESIAEGKRNKARVLSILIEKPLTFSELKEKAGISSPVLAKHLKALSEEGLIQKVLARDDLIVYQVISNKKAVSLLGALFANIFFYIVGKKLSAETMNSIRRDLEQVISIEESESFEKDFEQRQEQEDKVIILDGKEAKDTDENQH